MADRYLLPRRLDDPELIGFWTIDEFLGMVIPFAWGILAQHILVGIFFAFIVWFALRKAKSRTRKLPFAPCCLMVSARLLSGAQSHAALPLPTAGRLKEEKMDAQIAHETAQRLLRQRNWLALIAGGLAITGLIAISSAATRERELILVPITGQSLTISSAGVTQEYMEFITRDTALMLLNRSPESLDYWMEQILKIADPKAHGRLKAELVKIVTEQRGSDIAQAFVIRSLKVDPTALTSEVSGTLKTFVGAQVIASEERRFQFRWTYAGLRLSLSGFSQLAADADKNASQKDASQ